MRGMIRRAAMVIGVAVVVVPATAASASQGPVTSWTPTTSPGTFDYGTLTAGQTASQSFTLTNSGGSATAALTITLSGPAAFTKAADSCTGTSLGPGKSCTVTVSYHPASPGESDTGTLTATAHKVAAAASLTLLGAAPKTSPGISTTPSSGGIIGTTVTDTATLSGGDGPTGTITFNLYATPDCSGTAVDTQTVTVTGDGSYSTSGFAPAQPGTYQWTASYSGDASNNTAATTCGSESVTISSNWSAATEFPGQGSFTSVTCPDVANVILCLAVGQDGNGQPFYATYTAGTWSAPTEMTGTPGGSGSFTSVSCVNSNPVTCTAVGRDGNNQPFYASVESGVWGAPTEMTGTPGGSGSFTGVSCPVFITFGLLVCTAVGQDGNNQPFYANETENNRGGIGWSAPTEITGTPGGSGSFTSVSCPGYGCDAVGQDGNNLPFYVTGEPGLVGGTPTEITGTPGGSGSFNGAFCSGLSTDGCTAVGQDGNNQPIADTEGSSFTYGSPTEIAGAPGGAGYLTSVDCQDYLFCAAVGEGGNNQPFGVFQANGIWGAPVGITGALGGSGYLASLSCLGIHQFCMAVGHDGNDRPIYVTETSLCWGKRRSSNRPHNRRIPAANSGHTISPARSSGSIRTTALAASSFADLVRRPVR